MSDLVGNPEDRFSQNEAHLIQGVQCRMVLVVIFSHFFLNIFFCFVDAIFDLVYDVEDTHGLC